MRLRLLLFFNSILLFSAVVHCTEERKGRILNRDDYVGSASIEQQMIQEFSQNATAIDTTFDDVIEEIIDSSRQGRNIDGLDEVYSDEAVKLALMSGDDTQARNLIRDKLCDLGLMECEKNAPVRYIYTQPPPGAIYNQRPPQQRPIQRPPPPQVSSGVYGPARPVPLPGQYQPQPPPRKIGYTPNNLNSFHLSKPIGPISDKYSTDFYELEQSQSGVKFGYTEKPMIIVNQQGKREAQGAGVSQNHHVHHHYVHVDGNTPVDPTKTILVNTPISEYSAVNSLSGSYQTSGFSGAAGSGGGGQQIGFSPSAPDFEYKGVNGVNSGSQGIYSANSNVRPVFESNGGYSSGSNGQYASGSNYNQQVPPQQNVGPAVFTDGSNGIYNVGSSYHASQPDFFKKELSINGNRGNGLTGANYNNQQQQQQFNTQKYSKNQYNQGEQYQAFESARQDQYDCVCTPFDQCAAEHIVGRRDDLILPLDPRNLPSDIEADHANSTFNTASAGNSTEVKKISKRAIDDVEKVQGEGVSRNFHKIYLFFGLRICKKHN